MLLERDSRQVTIQVTVDLEGTMLEAENRIQDACNKTGALACAEALKQFDTDGLPTILSMIAVCLDLCEDHRRRIAAFCPCRTSPIGLAASPAPRRSIGNTPCPSSIPAIVTVTMSLDGARLPMQEVGWCEGMVGNLSLYTPNDERLYTIYLGEAPQYGKETFKQCIGREIERSWLAANGTACAERNAAADGKGPRRIREELPGHRILPPDLCLQTTDPSIIRGGVRSTVRSF